MTDLSLELLEEAPERLLEQLAAIHCSAFEAIGQQGWSASQIGSTLQPEGGFAVVAHGEGQARGFILIRVAAGEAELITVAVHPSAHRSGIARALVVAARMRLEAEGAETLFLEVRSDNVPAIALYEKLGFSKAGLRAGYYKTTAGERIDALMYQLDLG